MHRRVIDGDDPHAGTRVPSAAAPLRVMTVMGTRPEVIKMAPVLQALGAAPEHFASTTCVTGQHREMVDQMLSLFDITPDHDLDVMQPGQSLTDITRAVLAGMDAVLRAERPDWVLVQGDTTTVLAASLAAFYHGVRVGHVEAGLRTFDNRDPFPEEANRRLTSGLAKVHFAPTEQAAENLRREGIADAAIHVTGNTVIDALRHVMELPFDPDGVGLGSLVRDPRRVVLVTTHRKENTDHTIESICQGLLELTRRCRENLHLVFPVHLNPKVREPVHRYLGDVENVTLLDPVDYRTLLWLLQRCHFLLTDSGGLQEEAAGAGKPVLVLRQSTERPEGVRAGSARLIGSDPVRLVDEASKLLEDDREYERMARATDPCPYGDGRAAARIAGILRAAVPSIGARAAP